jgi:hypothetical protein
LAAEQRRQMDAGQFLECDMEDVIDLTELFIAVNVAAVDSLEAQYVPCRLVSARPGDRV